LKKAVPLEQVPLEQVLRLVQELLPVPELLLPVVLLSPVVQELPVWVWQRLPAWWQPVS
jgi:hypothetical protein